MTDKKDNAKEVLLKLIMENNLEILKIDCWNDDGDCCRCFKKEHPNEHCGGLYECNPKYYSSLEQLDFIYDNSSCVQELYGIVYCRDKVTKQPTWLTRECDDIASYWEVHRIPEFYNDIKNNEINKQYSKQL